MLVRKEWGGGGGQGTNGLHGRSRMIIDPRIHTMPRRSTLGFHRLDRHGLLAPSASEVRCWGSRMDGASCILRRTARGEDFLAYWTTAWNDSISFPVWPLPETATGVISNCVVGASPYTHYVIRPFLLCEVNILYPTQMIKTRPPAMVTTE